MGVFTLRESFEALNAKLKKLEALKGEHDQTVRTQVVEIVYGAAMIGDTTPTERFRQAEEDRIAAKIEANHL